MNKQKKQNKKPFGKFNFLMLRAFGYTEKDVKEQKIIKQHLKELEE